MSVAETNRSAAVEAWKRVKSILSDADRLSDPESVESCLTALTGSIPNFLNWSGITDFESHRFWESTAARTALDIPDDADLPALLMGLEGLKLKAEFDKAAQKLAKIEAQQKAYLDRAAARGLGEQAGDTALCGDPDFTAEAAQSIFKPLAVEPA